MSDTAAYEELILPFLHRMLNLEKLDLSIPVWVEKTFIDGNDLKTNVINHMSRLNTFTFNIRSTSLLYKQVNFPSNDDIQHTVRDFKNNHIISCVDYFSEARNGYCHIYSYPYKLEFYKNVTNNFPSRIFECVCEVSLFDERPFEHEFFLRIAQSFPWLKKLTVVNRKRQNNKLFKTSKNDNQDLLIIKYPRLTELILFNTHIDYVEQFLFSTKTCLPYHLCLRVDYGRAKKITRNFRRNLTRSNCAKLDCVVFVRALKIPEHLKDYFPCAQIL